jgi:cobalt/nickel transport system ATP-binding protein
MITVENVTVSYPDKTLALRQVSFTVKEGQSLALVGPNGAGKSTLLLALVGVLLPQQGTITIDGLKVAKESLPEIRRRVGMVFQNPDDQLFMPMIYDDLAFGPRNMGFSEEKVRALVEDTLERLQISHLKKRSSLKLSGGEKRMAAIGTVLTMNPSVIVLDEPSSFLDPKARRNLIGLLGRIKQTKIIATHDLDLALEACDQAVILNKGMVAASGSPQELFFDEGLMEACQLEALKRR